MNIEELFNNSPDGLAETFLYNFRVYAFGNRECEIFKNPNSKEMKAIGSMHNGVRAFLVGDDMIAWNPSEAVHPQVKAVLKLDNTAIPIILKCSTLGDRDAWIRVTDSTEGTPLWHDKTIANKIRANSYIKKYFPNAEITYYDSHNYGDWAYLSDEREDDVVDPATHARAMDFINSLSRD